MANITIVPFIRKSRLDKSGKALLAIKVYVGKKIVHYESLKHKIKPEFWNIEKHEIKRSAPGSAFINTLINKRISELEQRFLEADTFGQKLTANKIKRIAKGQDFGRNFIAYCKTRITERYPKESQKETRRSYNGELTKLQEFQRDISFGDITPYFLSRYKSWMILERGNSDNTIWKAFKFINTMLNDAISGGVIKENPFSQFDRGRYTQGKRSYLDIADCDKIHELLQKDIPDRLRLVGIYYLFMCYTGFRFQDAVCFFNYNEHVINDERIIFETQKTGTSVNLLIHSRLRDILDIIKSHPLNISNKEFNQYTKVLATMAGIQIKITAHTGRHTFGATLAELQVPIERAQKLLGHKDKRSTEIYYHIKNKNLDDEMMKWDKL